jgi:hypothetical protein
VSLSRGRCIGEAIRAKAWRVVARACSAGALSGWHEFRRAKSDLNSSAGVPLRWANAPASGLGEQALAWPQEQNCRVRGCQRDKQSKKRRHRAPQRIAHQPRRTDRSRCLLSRNCVSKKARSWGRVAASRCMRMLDGEPFIDGHGELLLCRQ